MSCCLKLGRIILGLIFLYCSLKMIDPHENDSQKTKISI